MSRRSAIHVSNVVGISAAGGVFPNMKGDVSGLDGITEMVRLPTFRQ